MLLSKYPFIESHTTIYRHYPDDASPWENRGALYTRIQVPETMKVGSPTNTYNLFLTQAQALTIKTETVLDDKDAPVDLTSYLRSIYPSCQLCQSL